MTDTSRRISTGYARLLLRGLRALLAIVALAALAAAITFPLWILADRSRTVYNVVFLAATVAFLLSIAVFRNRTARTRAPARRSTESIATFAIVAISVVLLVIGVALRSVVLIPAAVIAGTVPFAWRLGGQR
jgi:hypothetical protein